MSESKEIAIFWDYENVPLPLHSNAAEAAKSIFNAVSKYGRIIERRLYYDFSSASAPRDCSELDSSGFDLVNTPRRNQKETLDKKLIADVLTFAWDSAVRNDNKKPCIVLLTSDGDYAYTLSKLRDRGVMSIVMVGRDCSVAQILVDNADVALSFDKDVLSKSPTETTTRGKSGEPKASRAATVFVKNLPGSTEIRDLVSFFESNGCPVQWACLERADPKKPYCFAHVEFVDAGCATKTVQLAKGRATGGPGLMYKNNALFVTPDTNIPFKTSMDPSFCYEKNTSVSKEQASPNSSNTSDAFIYSLCCYQEAMALTQEPTTWIQGGTVGIRFRKKTSNAPSTNSFDMKEKYKRAQKQAVSTGLVEVGRRKLNAADKEIVSVSANVDSKAVGQLSPEIYVRLTENGVAVAVSRLSPRKASQVAKQHGSTRNVFCKNLPRNIGAKELTDFFEEKHGFVVRRALIEYSQLNIAYSFAHVEFCNKDDAARFLRLEFDKKIQYQGKNIYAMIDTRIPNKWEASPGMFYERNAETTGTAGAYDDDISNLCLAVSGLEEQIVLSHPIVADNWMGSGQVSLKFREILAKSNDRHGSSDDIRGRYQDSRNQAVKVGYIEIGRRKLLQDNGAKATGRQIIAVPWPSDSSGFTQNLSSEYYIRLTAKGKLQLPNTEDDNEADKMNRNDNLDDGTAVFISRLPSPADIRDIVHFFEAGYESPVQRAILDGYNSEDSENCSAHVDFMTATDARNAIRIASDTNGLGLIYCGRKIHAAVDKTPPLVWSNDDPTVSYEKNKSPAEEESTSFFSSAPDLHNTDTLAALYAESRSLGLATTSVADAATPTALFFSPEPHKSATDASNASNAQSLDLLW